MQLCNNTKYNGVSHLTTEHKHGVQLSTQHGIKFYNLMTKLYNESKKLNTTEFFIRYLQTKLVEIEKSMSEFIYSDDKQKKHKMDHRDIKGWEQWNQMTDEYYAIKAILKWSR